MVRQPAFSGYFYPDDPATLKKMIDAFYRMPDGPGATFTQQSIPPLLGIVVPHAGYQYSGPVAAWSFGALAQGARAETYVLLGPCHHPGRTGIALSEADVWQTPLGEVAVDQEAGAFLLSRGTGCGFDGSAHVREHSIEVQIPFLQYFVPGPLKILPIIMLDQSEEAAFVLSGLLAELSRTKSLAVIASSDFTHYEPESEARKKDLPLIELLTGLQVREFYRFLDEKRVTTCGPGCLAVLAGLQKRLSGLSGRLLRYATSGETSHDYQRVVGYASIIFPRGEW
ncbi:MAG TPA: AmmeMemoRadiSam system protein B [Atribacteraceae bacterium]|nr:AmmeMemoRadiSam system protein B [Atribacteraceae bacterium]